MFGVSSASYAAKGAVDQASHAELQAQIDQLKQELDHLNTNQNGARKDQSDAIYVTSDQKYGVFSDYDQPFAKYSSSRLPFSILSHRNKYSDGALIFGGYIEADATVWQGDKLDTFNGAHNGNAYQATSSYEQGWDLAINEADLYIVANLGHYVQASTVFTGASYADPEVRDAYVTFGNLDSSPVYLTVGKNRLSFGSFADGGPWIGGITQAMFRPGHGTVSANLGLSFGDLYSASQSKDHFNVNANLAVFQGKSDSNNKTNFMASLFADYDDNTYNFGGTLGYMYNWIGTGMGATSLVVSNTNSPNLVNDNRNGIVNAEVHAGVDAYFNLGLGWTGSTNKEVYSNNTRFGAWYIQADTPLPVSGKIIQDLDLGLGMQHAYNTNNLPFVMPGDETNKTVPKVLGVQNEYLAYLSSHVFSKNNLVSLELGRLD
ncbi:MULTISPECIES: DUF3573 domain-containing protein [Cysteiniphilum]|uniref:DUF3573 domain-containing protein n=1 Tax=Cysteiniphilum TaxID=2056696 RepID=UPI0017833696|nr:MULTISPECIES: DUF3573 domain-containing protein [Cysteiniphilum]